MSSIFCELQPPLVSLRLVFVYLEAAGVRASIVMSASSFVPRPNAGSSAVKVHGSPSIVHSSSSEVLIPPIRVVGFIGIAVQGRPRLLREHSYVEGKFLPLAVVHEFGGDESVLLHYRGIAVQVDEPYPQAFRKLIVLHAVAYGADLHFAEQRKQRYFPVVPDCGALPAHDRQSGILVTEIVSELLERVVPIQGDGAEGPWMEFATAATSFSPAVVIISTESGGPSNVIIFSRLLVPSLL